MDGSKLASPFSVVEGGILHLKVVAGDKEPLPTITSSPESIAKVIHVNARPKPHFSTFQLQALKAGKAVLQATGGGKPAAVLAGPLDVVVETRMALPVASSNEGLFVRLFLAETPSPDEVKATMDEFKTAMIWMRVVLENRLATPSGKWASAGAKNLSDVVKAANQFEGFSHYPTLPQGIQKNIDDAVSIANDGGDARRASYKTFVEAALAVAALPGVTDPCETGLYWWRTTGHGSPGDDTRVYDTKLGNTFFTIK